MIVQKTRETRKRKEEFIDINYDVAQKNFFLLKVTVQQSINLNFNAGVKQSVGRSKKSRIFFRS